MMLLVALCGFVRMLQRNKDNQTKRDTKKPANHPIIE